MTALELLAYTLEKHQRDALAQEVCKGILGAALAALESLSVTDAPRLALGSLAIQVLRRANPLGRDVSEQVFASQISTVLQLPAEALFRGLDLSFGMNDTGLIADVDVLGRQHFPGLYKK